MNSKTITGAKRMTRKEFLEEADRLLRETQNMLEAAERSMERARRIGESNQRAMLELEKRLSCGSN